MKIEYIRRGAATRLILIFAGWSTDARFYRECVADGWDTAVVYDYTDMSMPDLPPQYSTIYLFAYSLGVWAADRTATDATVRIAIFGTADPVSDRFGIPEAIFRGTADSLDHKSLAKFHLRMAGDKATYQRLLDTLPAQPDTEHLKRELLTIARQADTGDASAVRWNRAYLSKADRIFPFRNQSEFWNARHDTETITIDSPHAADMAYIINHCIPATADIGKGFARASATYRKHATVQSEICLRAGDIIDRIFEGTDRHVGKLLEIGPGEGMLSDQWSRRLSADSATYIDLYDMPEYGKSPEERYIKADAELWMESTSETFDLILSSSTIQWFANPLRFISELHRHLNDGGTAIITTFTDGNMKELDRLRPSPIFYHSVEEYRAAGSMQTIHWERVLEFDSARDLLMHLRQTGVQPSDGKKRLTSDTPFRLTSVPTRLTYRPAIIIIKKN